MNKELDQILEAAVREMLGEDPSAKREPDYHEQSNIGKAKYVVNYHDGVKTHPDGSKFYDIGIFHNKKKKDAFVRELSRKGYRSTN